MTRSTQQREVTRILAEKDLDLIRRRFLGRLARLGALAGIAGFVTSRLTERDIIPSVRADDGQPLIIGAENTGSGSRTRLESDVPEEFPVPPGYGVGGVLWLDNLSTAGHVAGLVCLTHSPDGETVHGHALATSGSSRGVVGLTDSPEGQGVYGAAQATSGRNSGVVGETLSPDGAGVDGRANATSGWARGVIGVTSSTEGAGVDGYATASTGNACGVFGRSESPEGPGVVGQSLTTSGHARGVVGTVESPDGAGVEGRAEATSGWARGVFGHTNSTEGAGVEGYASASTGNACGVWGQSESPDAPGVTGVSKATSGDARGVVGVVESPDGAGVGGSANATSGHARGVSGTSNSPDGAGVEGRSFGVGVVGSALTARAVPMVAQGYHDQTASLQEWRNSAGTPLAVVDAAGNLGIGTRTPARSVHLQKNNAVLRMDRDVNSSAFILVRTAAGDFNTTWKTFYVGVDASGVNNGSFFIGDVGANVSGASQKRLIIDNTGNIVPPTTNTGSIGTSSLKWASIYCGTLHHDDLMYENGVRTSEDGDGIAFYNPQGVKIAQLDANGNLRVRGDVIKDPNL
jgi:hypothetical protein